MIPFCLIHITHFVGEGAITTFKAEHLQQEKLSKPRLTLPYSSVQGLETDGRKRGSNPNSSVKSNPN